MKALVVRTLFNFLKNENLEICISVNGDYTDEHVTVTSVHLSSNFITVHLSNQNSFDIDTTSTPIINFDHMITSPQDVDSIILDLSRFYDYNIHAVTIECENSSWLIHVKY